MKWYKKYEDLYVYRMRKKPPKMPLNDYIAKYKESGDERFLQYFLHYYESAINDRTGAFCENHGVFHHFCDIKQTIIITMIDLVGKYDPAAGASLITFTNKHVTAAVHDYIRQNCGVICASEYDYDNLRNVMASYSDNPENADAERVQAAMERTGLKADAVRQHLYHGDLFRYSESLTGGDWQNEDDGYLQLVERIGDIFDTPEYIVLKKSLYEAIAAAVDGLPFRERRIILDYCGLERDANWFKEACPMFKTELAARLHIGSVHAVDSNFRRAVATLREKLESLGWV